MPSTFNYSDVMISYSRKDKPFIRQLDEALRQAGREVWIDWEDIPPTADWWKEIQAGIEAANTIIFVMTPDSVQSSVCREELEHAVSHNKRIIPILFRDVGDPQVKVQMHQALQQHNWIMFREEDNFDSAMRTLLKALETDLIHVGIHTKLLVRAREWDTNQRKNGFLLRGDDLREAERWLAKGLAQDPIPTALQVEYIQASRKAATRLRQAAAGAMLVALVILSFLTARVFAESQNTQVALETANSALTLAIERENGRATAVANAVLEADLHATAAQDALNQNATAQILQGVAHQEADNAATQAQSAQDHAATATVARGQAQIEAGNARRQAAIAQQNAVKADDNANIAGTEAANAQTQQSIAEANANLAGTKGAEAAESAKRTQALQLAESSSQALASGDRQLALTLALAAYSLNKELAEVQNAVLAANYAPGLARRFTVPLSLQSGIVTFSDEGKQVQITPPSGTPLAWDIQTGAPVAPVPTPNSNLSPVGVRVTSEFVITEKTITLTVFPYGTIVTNKTDYQLNHAGNATAHGYSSDGKLFVSGDDTGLVYLWDVISGAELHRFAGHSGKITNLAFNPSGTQLVSYAADHTLRVWDLTSLSVTGDPTDASSNGPRAIFALSPGGNWILSWDSVGNNLKDKNYPTNRIILWDFLGQSADKWDNASAQDDPFIFANFSPNSSMFVYATDNKIYLHNVTDVDDQKGSPYSIPNPSSSEEEVAKQFLGSQTIAFSFDSKYLLITQSDSVHLLDTSTKTLLGKFATDAGKPAQQVFMSGDNRIAFIMRDGFVDQWNISSLTNSQPRVTLIPDSSPTPDSDFRLNASSTLIVLSPTEVIVGETSGIVRLWNPQTNAMVGTFLGHTQRIVDMAVYEDPVNNRTFIAAIAADKKVLVWDKTTGQVFYNLVAPEPMSALRFKASPNSENQDELQLYAFSVNRGYRSRLYFWTLPSLSGNSDTIISNVCDQDLVSGLSDTQIQQLHLTDEQRDVCALLTEKDQGGASLPVITAPDSSIIEAESSSITQIGSWEQRDNPAASSGHYLVNTTPDSSSKLTLMFNGTGIDVLYAHDPAFGTFTIQVDGEMQPANGLGAGSAQFDGRAIVKNLPNGQHTLTVIPLLSHIGIDGFVVHTAPTPETTLEVIAEITLESLAEANIQAVSPLDNFGWSGDINWALTDQGWHISAGSEFGVLTLNVPIDMTDNQPSQLKFQSFLSVEDIGGSIAAVQSSTDNQNWSLLHTLLPTNAWNNEIVDLSSFIGQTVHLRLIWFFVPSQKGQAEDFWIVNNLDVGVALPATETLPPTVDALPTETLTLEPILTEFPTITLESATATLFLEVPTPTEIPLISFAAPVGLPVIDNLNSGASDWNVVGGWELDEIDSGDLGWYTFGIDGILTWSKPLDFSTAQMPLLMFDSLLTAQVASATVQVSSDGFNWMPVLTVARQGIYEQSAIDLSPYVGQVVYIRFVWQTENESGGFWFIDNIRVEDTALTMMPAEPEVTQDAVVATVFPEEISIATETETFEAVFTETSVPEIQVIAETATSDEASNSTLNPEPSG